MLRAATGLPLRRSRRTVVHPDEAVALGAAVRAAALGAAASGLLRRTRRRRKRRACNGARLWDRTLGGADPPFHVAARARAAATFRFQTSWPSFDSNALSTSASRSRWSTGKGERFVQSALRPRGVAR